ncbi:MAG: hypothetical protein [Vetruanivirus porcinprimi]|uniref:Uncharacterized protein n=1 Tax=phage Lak_Megaphage_RVC_AP1_GC26 TaxID=3109224 RepID=A0ABZ0Z7K2_9CAUD|nr:MAG: hypothetical protein [phage Lak_Megaphage_RVC_AP1_GC26]
MNTKYPINGRVATLNDIVHEYGASSSWPKSTKYTFLDTSNIVSQPFQNLVFKDTLDANNKFVGERPYEIVYFDNVYSTTERDTTGKHMKIIQKNDSDVFSGLYPGGISGHEYIKAGDVANPLKIIEGKYGFKFIVASQNDKKQYYYNYRTSTGEATVMYALRNIIKILKENDKNLLTCIQQLFIPKIDKDDNKTYPEINNIINNNELKTDAYKYLGDFIWTYKNIQIKNYTTTEQSILNIAVSKGYLKLDTNTRSSINDVLNEWVGKNIDNNYSYNQESQYNHLKYYLNIFANSQRFFVSYVTGFRFGKISNKSYLQIDPVLRCDLGVLRIYESLIIISAIHDWQTALPAGEITYDTSINIILKYKVKYKNIQTYSSPIITTIGPITFNDIKKYREPTIKGDNEETIENDIWYTLKTYVTEKNNQAPPIPYGKKYDENTKYYDNTYKYGTTYFPALPSDEFSTIDSSVSTISYSLQDLRWPANEDLQLSSIKAVEESRNNPKFSNPNNSSAKNAVDTNNISAFGTNTSITDIVSRGIAPFGILRIHNSLELTDKNKKTSAYYIDTSIYRCKNYYYIDQSDQSSDTATVNAYFTPRYKSYSPYIEIPIYRTDENLNSTELSDKFKNILDTLGNYYSMPSNLNTLYFTVQSGSAKTITYASGYIKKQDNNDAKYTNNNTFEFYYIDPNDNNSWIKYTDSDIIVTAQPQTNNIVNQYEISFNFSKIYSKYWQIKLSDIKQNFYFRCNQNINAGESKMYIYNLFVTDNMDGTIEYQLGVYTQNPNDLSLKYAIFIETSDNDYLNKQNALYIFDSTFNNSSNIYTINTDSNKSIYIQLISIKNSERYISNYSENLNKIILYAAYPEYNDGKNKYKFVNTIIFYGKYQNSRVKIENYINKPNIYLSFEPIYIIKTGNITESKDNNVIAEYKNFFKPDKLKLKYIKLNNSGNIKTVESNKDGTFINSIYSKTVYIDSDSIYIDETKLSDIIFSDNNGINNYLFEFLIIFNNITKNEKNFITINNTTDNFNIDNFNSSLKEHTFVGNNEYEVSMELNMFILK